NRADRDETENLDAELVERAGVDEPGRSAAGHLHERGAREQSARERPPDAGGTVHREGADGIVDPDPLEAEWDEDADDPGDDSDQGRRPRLDEARRRRDRDERAEGTVQRVRDVGL